MARWYGVENAQMVLSGRASTSVQINQASDELEMSRSGPGRECFALLIADLQRRDCGNNRLIDLQPDQIMKVAPLHSETAQSPPSALQTASLLGRLARRKRYHGTHHY
jgi:hypothetical protein